MKMFILTVLELLPQFFLVDLRLFYSELFNPELIKSSRNWKFLCLQTNLTCVVALTLHAHFCTQIGLFWRFSSQFVFIRSFKGSKMLRFPTHQKLR